MTALRGKKQIIVGGGLFLALVSFVFALPFIPQSTIKIIKPSFLESIETQHALVFFGFQGCSDACPTALAELSHLKNLQGSTDPQLIFVDIDANSNQQRAEAFAKTFHHSFIAYHLDNETQSDIDNLFGLKHNQTGTQITHQGKTYLLTKKNQEWLVSKVYNPKSFSIDDIRRELNK
ncbi:SCO family protein [Vibrio lamellibrachiae]|uniref:SCO family protein n=1 Tax=Vibrio lamellibrachiae TaxID=2910253 RepID=UPI003D0EE7DE